jgi:hypothetical protein
MNTTLAYSVIVFYGFLLVIFAAVGNYFDKKNGFSNGFVLASIVNLVLWFTKGRKLVNA